MIADSQHNAPKVMMAIVECRCPVTRRDGRSQAIASSHRWHVRMNPAIGRKAFKAVQGDGGLVSARPAHPRKPEVSSAS